MEFYSQEIRSCSLKHSEPNSILPSLARDHLSSVPSIVYAFSFCRLNLTKYYANPFPLILATASVEKFQSYLYKVNVQEPGLIHETFNHSFHHRP